MSKSKTDAPQKQKKRVPNVERSARTRAKLIDATINSLYELGYHQTTTVVVAKRAGVSRGAMLHQFPSKADLMIAAAEHMRDLRKDLHRERMAPLPTMREKYLKLIDVLWEALLSPSGVARIELMLSTRSDPELADRFSAINDELDKAHKERIWGMAQALGIEGEANRKRVEAFTQLYAASLRGLAIDALRPGSRAGAGESVELLKSFQKSMLDEMITENR